MLKFAKYHLPALLYGILIISLSTIAYLKSPHIRHIPLDKVAHFIEYGIFAFLVHRSFSHLSQKIRPLTAMLMAFTFILLFASADETCQRFVPGRDANIFDFLSDLLGAVVMLLVLWLQRIYQSGDPVGD